ncbi:MAG: S9 family peptidase [candidate division WOR-3 bacterium]|nr:MAG: S9 family peptidase [candidate division WOR-3 bacterium]
MGKRIAFPGSWRSPITADLVAGQSIRFGEIIIDDDNIFWVESRPAEHGRSVIVCCDANGKLSDMIAAPYSARSRVHEYGGAAFTVREGVLFFTNFSDQRVYRKEPNHDPLPLTPEGDRRYADLQVDARLGRMVCVQEDHSRKGEPVNAIVGIDISGTGKPQLLVSGNDFYASPRCSPDGSKVAWLTWNHPNMPWDGTELWIADVDRGGTLSNLNRIAGGISESIFQPEWSPEGILYFASDRSGWWNLCRFMNGKYECVIEMDAEFGMPLWNFGLSTYGFLSSDRIACTYNQKGIFNLAIIDLHKKMLTQVASQFTEIAHLKTTGDHVVFQGGSSIRSMMVVKFNTRTSKETVIKRSEDNRIDPGYFSSPVSIEFKTTDDLISYGFYYPPQNKEYDLPPNELPPLIVITHGGPTSCSYTSLDLKIQFWTSRGFAVLDVNYAGSTGFGRPYRERLKGNWGIVDVDDCVNAARYLVDEGLVDGSRVIIRGGSAGGYTTLCALTFRDFFKAGASYYGISDLETLTRDTHKFESRYLDSLVGSYPEARKTYLERSPFYYAERLASPVIFFQGLEDEVVPPAQAEKMVNVLREKGIPVAYLTFEEEQHGFRRSDNISRALEAELYFYSRIFGFELSDNVEPVEIENP